MGVSDDGLATGQPRVEVAPSLTWAPGFASHQLSDDEVVLLSESGNHALRGRVYAVISPLINGRRTADEVVAAAKGEVESASAYYALLRLQSAGLLVDRAGDETTARKPEIAVFGLPADAGQRLRDRLAEPLPSCLGALAVGLTDDYLRPEVDALARRSLAAGSSFLPIRPVGHVIWVGPLLRPGSEQLWRLFLSRLRLNRPADIQALERGAAFPLVPTGTSPAMMDLGLAMGATALNSAVGGDDPAGLDGFLLTVDRENLELTRHPIAHVDDGPVPPVPEFRTSLPPVALNPRSRSLTTDGGYRVARPEVTLQRLGQVVSPITGVVSWPQRFPNGALHPVYTANYAGQHLAPESGPALKALPGAAGKGVSDSQARASCTAEAVERYSCAFFPDSPRRRARLDEIADIALDPREVLLFSEAQYANRAERSQGARGFNHVPAPFDPSQPIEWTPLLSLVSGRTKWVATAHCFFGYRDPEARGDVFQYADSNGCAAGNTFEEAVFQGLLELIERDAVATWWYSRSPRPQVDLASFGDSSFTGIVEFSDLSGRELRVLDLTVDTGVPVVAAVRWRREDGGGIELGFGAHLDPRIAVSRALSELEQCSVELQGSEVRGFSSPEFAAWHASATIENQPYVTPSAGVVTASDLLIPTSDNISEGIHWCVGRLEALGHDVLVYDHTRPDVRFPVVRVVAPGLRHFWQRLAPGRLYDVPVELGWIPRRLSEDQLNPIAMFL